MKRIIRNSIVILMVLNGLLFISNIYVLGSRAAAIQMHEDLAPDSSVYITNIKVVLCLLTGILYLAAALGIIRNNRKMIYSGVLSFILFDGFYIAELIMWGGYHPMVWFGFITFGGLNFLYGIYCWRLIKKTV